MLLTFTRLSVLTGAALLAGSIAFADSGLGSLELSKTLKSALLQEAVAPKGDRLADARPAQSPTNVSIVEIVGIAHATVILRDSHGEVLYRSDPRSGITTISKNTELPVLTLKEDAQGPAVQHPPVSAREGNEDAAKAKRQTPVGCMGDVSPLARAGNGRMPSLCLASLTHPLS